MDRRKKGMIAGGAAVIVVIGAVCAVLKRKYRIED